MSLVIRAFSEELAAYFCKFSEPIQLCDDLLELNIRFLDACRYNSDDFHRQQNHDKQRAFAVLFLRAILDGHSRC